MWVLLGRIYVALMLMGNAWVMKHRNEDTVEAIEATTESADEVMEIPADEAADEAYSNEGMESDPFDPLNTPPIVAHVMPAKVVKEGGYYDINAGSQEAIPYEVFEEMNMGPIETEDLL